MKQTELAQKSQEIKAFIESFIEENGFSPSMREIAHSLNIKSTKTVFDHINRLEMQGLIKRPSKNHARGIVSSDKSQGTIKVPLVGKITAGIPITAVENVDDLYDIPSKLFKSGELFMLKVSGDSMKNCGIFNNDLIIVRRQSTADNGEIVAASINNEATVKRFYREKDHIRLQPENEEFEPIISTEVEILGVVVGLVRNRIG